MKINPIMFLYCLFFYIIKFFYFFFIVGYFLLNIYHWFLLIIEWFISDFLRVVADITNIETGLSPPVVKSSGIFYPLSPFPNLPQGGTRTSTPRSEAGALVMAIPPSRPQNIPSFSMPVSGGFTITSTPRISQVPPSTPPTLSDSSGGEVKLSTSKSPENFSSPDLINPEKLLPEHHPR